MRKAVFYGRYSSVNQTEQSIEGQLHVCEKYAEQNGLEIIAQYVDRAQSGKTANRKEFQRMITDSEKGMFEAVLVYKLDRFARNRFDSAMYGLTDKSTFSRKRTSKKSYFAYSKIA